MSQHLYPCTCCGVYGTANYILRALPNSGKEQWYENVLVCTGCRIAKCVAAGTCQKRKETPNGLDAVPSQSAN